MSKTRPPNKQKRKKKRQNLSALPKEDPKLTIIQSNGLSKLADVIYDLYFSLKKSPEDAVTSPRPENTERWYVHIGRIISNRVFAGFIFACIFFRFF